jgi:hypothetical protein
MPARRKVPLGSDLQAPEIREKGKNGRKSNPPRYGDEPKASSSTVQIPIQRPDDGPEMTPQFGDEIPDGDREGDKAVPTSSTVQEPIIRECGDK